MVERGFSPLPIPSNYYCDLAARFELDPKLLERMQHYGILYDSDEGGEFFHFFTPTVGEDLFFEVVQRTGTYADYAETNSAVRVSSQFRP